MPRLEKRITNLKPLKMETEIRAIYDKCTDVIASCKNEMQMNGAANYKDLAIKRLRELSKCQAIETIVNNINFHYRIKRRHL
jgi:hypothetical protein